MSDPAIICVAITGSVPTKADNLALPVIIAEQVESARAAYPAGAIIAHCLVRYDDGKPTSGPDPFARLKDGIEREWWCNSSPASGRARAGMLRRGPEWRR